MCALTCVRFHLCIAVVTVITNNVFIYLFTIIALEMLYALLAKDLSVSVFSYIVNEQLRQ